MVLTLPAERARASPYYPALSHPVLRRVLPGAALPLALALALALPLPLALALARLASIL